MPRVLSPETIARIDAACEHYPTRMAAMIPALHMVQDELGHVTREAALDVADALDVPPTRVNEVVTFYTMLYNRPVGEHVVKICRNLACQLRGADQLIAKAREILGIELGETTADGKVTLDVDECLASCGTAPMLWCRSRKEKTDGAPEVQERIVENLSVEKLEKLLGELTA